MVEQESDSCIICQEEGKTDTYLVENRDCKCKYFYHESCFPSERRKKCPMCSKEIKSNHVAVRVGGAITTSRLDPVQVTMILPLPTNRMIIPLPTNRMIIPLPTNRMPLLSPQSTQITRQQPSELNQSHKKRLNTVLSILCLIGFLSVFIIIIKYYV